MKERLNIKKYFADVQLIALTLVTWNSIMIVDKYGLDFFTGFALISGLAFVGMILYLRNLETSFAEFKTGRKKK